MKLCLLVSTELDKLLENAPSPVIAQHAARISSIRKRELALNMLLRSIQRRIDNMDRMISTGVTSGTIHHTNTISDSLSHYSAQINLMNYDIHVVLYLQIIHLVCSCKTRIKLGLRCITLVYYHFGLLSFLFPEYIIIPADIRMGAHDRPE